MSRSIRKPSLWMIGASLAFTGMAACIKLAAEHDVPTGQILFYRGAVSLVLMYLFLRLRRMTLATPHWKAHAARGVTPDVRRFAMARRCRGAGIGLHRRDLGTEHSCAWQTQ
jgi:hypothetical protein